MRIAASTLVAARPLFALYAERLSNVREIPGTKLLRGGRIGGGDARAHWCGLWRGFGCGLICRRWCRLSIAETDRSLFRDLAVIVDVQVETLTVTAGVELEWGLGPSELELLKALLGQLAANTLNTVGAHRSSPVPCNED